MNELHKIGKELTNIYSYTQISFLQVTPSFHLSQQRHNLNSVA